MKEPKTFVEQVDKKLKSDVPEDIKKLAEDRWQAKKEKNFALADSLRQEILTKGYEIKDSKDGYEILKSN